MKNLYFCNVKKENKPALQNVKSKTKKIMEKKVNEIKMLQYQIKRYYAMGNGTKCQVLTGKLQKLTNESKLSK
ncbi:hypothetical protein EZS27_007148 [termite gut metagenome]|uniref:Uncharacterized protein n=1 Tax=termite gut metagenome TaxID=433724 RepID=A0A5J4SGR9_9ZZZZ